MGGYDYFNKTDHANKIGNISPFIAYTLLNAEFNHGINKGRSPAFAPHNTVKTGVNYKWRDRVKLSLFATFVDDQFADDAGTANRYIPSYKVWDLLGEVNLCRNAFNAFDVSLFGGVNNMFDEKYYSRITSTGIDPAFPRNIYGGVKIAWGFNEGGVKAGSVEKVPAPRY